MSDVSEDSIVKSDKQLDKDESNNICRDFIRGICDRKFCKYRHETETRTLNFCHDYQNNMCPRPNCKFIHCSLNDVDEYKKTGIMSHQILAEASRKNQLPGLPPICNQFRKGMCRRSNCKFRHLMPEDEEAEIIEMIQRQTNPVGEISEMALTPVQTINSCQRTNQILGEYIECGPPIRKRRMVDNSITSNYYPVDINRNRTVFKGYFAGNPPTPILNGMVDARTLILEEEINLLHKEINQLKRQVSDLTATNEFLLDQNATLRVNNKHTNGVPNVSLTNNNPQPIIRTVTASVAPVPVSIATVTVSNPVSCNPVSIAAVPSVSVASPAQLLAPSQQIFVTTNPSTQLAIANSSQAQLAIAQQNLANNLAAQQAQPQLSSQAQQIALATTNQLTTQALNQAQQLATQQLTSQAQQLANQQLTSQAQQLANQQLTSQAQQLANQQLTSQALASQQLANQQLTSQAQQLATQQLTSQARQLATQQLTSQAQQLNQQISSQTQLAQLGGQPPSQLTLAANTELQLTSQAQLAAQIVNTSQQLAMANTAAQVLTSQAQLSIANQQQQLVSPNAVSQQLALAQSGRQLIAAAQQNLASATQMQINTSQPITISNAASTLMSYPIVTHPLSH